jgi:hypothetical protein
VKGSAGGDPARRPLSGDSGDCTLASTRIAALGLAGNGGWSGDARARVDPGVDVLFAPPNCIWRELYARRKTSALLKAHAMWTVRGVPEVVIKVSGGARTIRGVAAHLEYLETRADLETDDGAVLAEKGLGRELLKGWDLEVDEIRRHTPREQSPPVGSHQSSSTISSSRCRRARPRTGCIKLCASSPWRSSGSAPLRDGSAYGPGTSARAHRGESWKRAGRASLYPKGHAPEVRRDFAQYLRDHGVEANATERAVRGSHHQNRKDGIFRAAGRGESTFIRARVESVARELAGGGLIAERGKGRCATQKRVWCSVSYQCPLRVRR